MKKILCTVLACICLFQGLTAAKAEESRLPEEYEGILEYMGIYEPGAENDEVARGEFVGMTLKLLGVNAEERVSETFEGHFIDVDKDSPWYNDIGVAYEKGIISGYTDEYFAPDESISVNEAVKIVLSAMSYSVAAEAMGGYPGGYLAVADEIELLDNVSGFGTLKRFDAYTIMYNALECSLMNISVDGSGNISYTYRDDGNTLLEKMDIRIEEGIVTAAGYFSAYSSSSISAPDRIEINRVAYDYPQDAPAELLGKYVKAYINEEENSIAAVCVVDNYNTVTNVRFEDVFGIETGEIKYYDENKSARVKISESANVLVNNSYYASMEYAVKDGVFDDYEFLVITDNDRDGEADFIDVKKYSYYLVEMVYPADGIILLANDKGQIDTEDDNNIVKITKDEMDFAVSMLLADDVLKVAESKLVSGRTFYDIIAARNTVTGKITGTSQDDYKTYYEIDGKNYEVSKEYLEYLQTNETDVKPGFGDSAAFMLSNDNKIVFARSGGGYNYGYIMNVLESEDTGEYQCIIKLYTTDKKAGRYSAAEKVTLYSGDADYYNGKKIKAEDCYKYLAANYNFGVIMYELNDEDEIKTIIIPIDNSGNEPASVDYPLREDFNDTKTEWSADFWVYFGVLGYKYMMNSATPVIYAPVEAGDKNNEENYIVKTASSFGNDTEFPNGTTLKIYNTSKFYVPELIVVENSVGANADISAFTNVSVVSEVSRGLNSEDIEGVKISYINSGKEESAFLKSNAQIVYDDTPFTGTGNMTVNDIKPGDILQLTKDFNDEIDYIRVLFRKSNAGDYRIEDDNGANSGFAGLAIVYGMVTDKNESAVLVKTDDVYPMFLTTHYGTKYYTLVDSSTKKPTVSAITLNDIRKGDEVVVRKRYNEACEFVIYR